MSEFNQGLDNILGRNTPSLLKLHLELEGTDTKVSELTVALQVAQANADNLRCE